MRKFLFVPLAVMCMLTFCSTPQKNNNSNTDDLFRKLAIQLSAADVKMKSKTIAIYGFQIIGRGDDTYTRYATEKLTHELVSIGKLSVIERSRIDEVLSEQQFTMSGAVDSAKAAKIGKILSVEGVVIGTITIRNNEVEYIARIVQSENAMILSSANERVKTAAAYADTGDSVKPEQKNSDDVPAENKQSGTVTLDKTFFSSSEPVVIRYSGLPGNQYDWITLVAASNSDSTYGEWFYTQGQKEGTHTFAAQYPGDYEVRMYLDWPAGGYIVQIGRAHV